MWVVETTSDFMDLLLMKLGNIFLNHIIQTMIQPTRENNGQNYAHISLQRNAQLVRDESVE